MSPLLRKNITFRLDKLPKLISRSVTIDGHKAYTGTIVRRRIRGPVKLYWHYAFIYGVDENNNLLLLENNENGVECITWIDFLSDVKGWEAFYVESTPDNYEEIMNRAKKRAKYLYHRDKNNCEHFVNFCLFDKLESLQVDNTKLGVNALLFYWEARAVNTPGDAAAAFLRQLNKFRDTIGVSREDAELDEIVQNRIQENPRPKNNQ